MTHAYHESSYVQYCSKVKSFLDRWWVKYVFGPLIVTAPAGLITLYLSEKQVPHEFAAFIIPLSLQKALNNHHVMAYGISIAWIYVCTLLYGVIDTLSKKRKVDVQSLLFLHRALEIIVESKAYRFGKYARHLRGKKLAAGHMFNEITQPDQQIALLARGLHSFFSHLYPDVGIRVGIATIKNGVPQDWLFWEPENRPPRTPIENLQNPNSTLSICLKRREMVIVEDTLSEGEKENNRCFIHTREGAKDAQCSLICEPIIDVHIEDVPYVVNIAADKKDVFLEKHRDLYQWMLGPFELRMLLEHNLLTIKESQEVKYEPEKSSV